MPTSTTGWTGRTSTIIPATIISDRYHLSKAEAEPLAALRFFFFLAALATTFVLLPPSANALETSPQALRWQDTKRGNLLLGAESAKIQAGELFNTVILLWGDLEVHGQVEEILVLSGRVVFHPGAKLGRSLVMMGGGFEALPGAEVADEKISLRAPGPLWRMARAAGGLWRENVGWVAAAFGAAGVVLFFWALGSLLFAFFPKLQILTADRLGREWAPNLLAGLLGTVLVPILCLLLVVSVLGILALPVLGLLLAFAGVSSYAAAGLWAGHRLLPPAPGRRVNYLGFFLGLTAMQVLWMLGGIGYLPVLFLWTLGWGALLRGIRSLGR